MIRVVLPSIATGNRFTSVPDLGLTVLPDDLFVVVQVVKLALAVARFLDGVDIPLKIGHLPRSL